MKRFISAVLLSAAVAMPTMAQKQKTLGNGYPFTQVPFTSVKISQNTFWGARLKAAREVTVPLAFSKCESEHRYKNFEMAAYTLQHPNHPGLNTKERTLPHSRESGAAAFARKGGVRPPRPLRF